MMFLQAEYLASEKNYNTYKIHLLCKAQQRQDKTIDPTVLHVSVSAGRRVNLWMKNKIKYKTIFSVM